LHDGTQTLSDQLDLAVCASARIALRCLPALSGPPQRVLALGDARRLQHAESEARAVAALFAQTDAATGDLATLDTLRTRASGVDVLHLACHAVFRHDNPMFSALQLADGPLTAEQIEGLRLQAGIVVLSACETGLAGEQRGDELVGLVRAFMIAGAARVMASLWPVDDQVTTAFMNCFYAALCSGRTPASALRQAQQAVKRSHPHPFYWAAFTLHGGW
jgi:CHAT domain-containing protein